MENEKHMDIINIKHKCCKNETSVTLIKRFNIGKNIMTHNDVLNKQQIAICYDKDCFVVAKLRQFLV